MSLDAQRPRLDLKQWFPLLLVMTLGLLVAQFFYFGQGLQPQEDAAMLLRYAGHLAQGHGIVWNVGEAPVDGATDFLFMVMVAGLSKFGLRLEVASLLLTFTAHLLTVFLVYRMLMRQSNNNVWAASFSALVVMMGPAFSYIEAGFGTTVFALAGLWTFLFFLQMLQHGFAQKAAIGFAVASLCTGLIRPEGVLLSFGMLSALVVKLESEDRKALLLRYGIFMGIPGALYFGWHWFYFGYPLPNPFYVKGGGRLYVSSLSSAMIGAGKMSFVLVPLLLYGIWKGASRTQNLYLLWPVAFFVGIWILMSNAMNYNHRFQYVLMPILWVAWLPVLQSIWPDFRLKGWKLALGIGMTALMLTMQAFVYVLHSRMHVDGRAQLGTALSDYADKGYTMAITEAGNLPFYSNWKAIDTWGLNDKTISHTGIVESSYLDQYSPELIMIHDYWSPGKIKLRPQEKWAVMTDTLEAYIQRHNYENVACWGRKPDNAHFYYLKRDFPDYEKLKALIQGFRYSWHEDGDEAVNFLQEE